MASPQTPPCPWIDSPSYLGKEGGGGEAGTACAGGSRAPGPTPLTQGLKPKSVAAPFPLAPRGMGWKLLLHQVRGPQPL